MRSKLKQINYISNASFAKKCANRAQAPFCLYPKETMEETAFSSQNRILIGSRRHVLKDPRRTRSDLGSVVIVVEWCPLGGR